MISTFGTNSAGTKEWLNAAKDMYLSAAEPVFSRSEITIVKSEDSTEQDKTGRRKFVSQSAAKTK